MPSSFRRWAPTVTAVLAVLAAAPGCRAASTTDEMARPLTDEQAGAACRRDLAELNGEIADRLEQRFVARDGDGQIRVYVSEPDERISTCRLGASGVEETFATRTDDGPQDKIIFYGGADAVLKAHLLIGRLPARASSITASLPSGATLTGSTDRDLFLIWAPGTAVGGARLTARATDGTTITTATAPGLGT
ncbi:hypothetical protein M1L60_26355 [Actinoplanes sp. TRM 88003]|uniref:Lipoprotein n=1 Tax=Paractinoplanes aksuensis TaxID=2939490 RepID=A0ABT1DTE9_9ACTN|nr:hypothetical protein [Actinoplanes aksuensis]MCO8274128.1 hypothetical protein [Actinoplanes aksuensis]